MTRMELFGRKPLEEGTLLRDNEGKTSIRIGRIFATGGSCLVYRGEWLDFPGILQGAGGSQAVLVKECYPVPDQCALRREGTMLVPAGTSLADTKTAEHTFEAAKTRFRKSNRYARQFYSETGRRDLFMLLEANGTLYTVSLAGRGFILADVPGERLSLEWIAQLMMSLCRAIGRLHEDYVFYLDCKPENILCAGEDNTEAVLFDFDSVTPGEYAAKGSFGTVSASSGWAAPEQILAGGGYARPREINEKTDCFSIGAVFFWLLCGAGERRLRFSLDDRREPDSIVNGSFDWEAVSALYRKAEEPSRRLIRKILGKAVAFDNADRQYAGPGAAMAMYRDFQLLQEEALRERLSAEGRQAGPGHDFRRANVLTASKNRFRYNSDSAAFAGRNQELDLLTRMCEAEESFLYVGIAGAGGIGKSRLAYELCRKMKERGWLVFSPMHYGANRERIRKALEESREPVLVCLDYVKQDMDSLAALFQSILESPYERTGRIRFVLIERRADDLRFEDPEITWHCYAPEGADFLQDGVLEMQPLQEEDLRKIVADYIHGQEPAAAFTRSDEDLIIRTLQAVDPAYRRPLYALFTADAWLNGENLRDWDRDDALGYHVRRELKLLGSIIRDPAYRLNKPEQAGCKAAVLFLYVLATYLGGCELQAVPGAVQADAMLAETKKRCPECQPAIVEDMLREAGILTADGVLRGLTPDLAGEYLCIDYFNHLEPEKVSSFLRLAMELDLTAFVRYSEMIWNDFPDRIEGRPWLPALRNLEFPEQYDIVRKNQFRGCHFLQNIHFSGGVTRFRAGAFRDCVCLQQIVFPDSLEIIEQNAFSGCSGLESAVPEQRDRHHPSVVSIEKAAFKNCTRLTEVILPNSVAEIGVSAFENCTSLREVSVPCKVETLSSRLFAGCRSLEKVSLSVRNSKGGIHVADNCFNGCSSLARVEGSRLISRIGNDAFVDCAALKTLPLSSRLTGIGDNVFAGCVRLEQMDLSQCHLNSIPKRLFYGCHGLETVLLPSGITTIGDKAFQDCAALTGINLPEGLCIIERNAFRGCAGLSGLCMPVSLEEVGSSAFEDCGSLRELTFQGRPARIGARAFCGCHALKLDKMKGLALGKGAVFCGFRFRSLSEREFAFLKTYPEEEVVEIPETVEEIQDDAFWGQETLRKVILPAGVRNIGRNAFRDCVRLKTVVLRGSSLRSIGESAFYGCSALEEIRGILDVQAFRYGTFQGCAALKHIAVTGRLEKIGRAAFLGCSGLETIGNREAFRPLRVESSAFSGCSRLHYPIEERWLQKWGGDPGQIMMEGFRFRSIGAEELAFVQGLWDAETVRIPDTCVSMEGVAFDNLNRMKRLFVPDSLGSLPEGAFSDCEELEEISLPGSLRRIPFRAFAGCRSLRKLTFRGWEENRVPDGTTIDNSAFRDCRSLARLILPADLKEIHKLTFFNCTALETMVVPPEVRQIDDFAFNGCVSLRVVELPPSLKIIGKCAFRMCASLQEIRGLENTELTVIRNNVFESCMCLEDVRLPHRLEQIMGWAFKSCHRLSVPENFLPETVREIGPAAFQDCYSLEKLRLPRRISRIEDYTFKNCSALREIALPDGIRSIGQSAFYNCNRLESSSLQLPAGLETVGMDAFAYCHALRSVTVPEGMVQMAPGIWKGCTGLEKAVLPDSMTEIPPDCFKGCGSLELIQLPASLEIINVGAFRNCHSLKTAGCRSASRQEPDGDDTGKKAVSVFVLPDTLREIRESAFRGCTGLEAVEIPAGIDRIAPSLFEGCSHLQKVSVEGRITRVGSYAFYRCPALRPFPQEQAER